MFSYRPAFHTGSHADILKHLTLIHLVQYLQEKSGALTIVDTDAGAGIYSLQDKFSTVSKEADGGIFRLKQYIKTCLQIPPESIQAYLKQIDTEKVEGRLDNYPGSPFMLARLLRHNVNQLKQSKQIDVYAEDSFTSLKGLLPSPSRHGLILIDPSYEDKQDYRYLETAMQEALTRFATGCYAIWYPAISRRESAALPDFLKKIAANHKRSWLNTELRVENAPGERRLQSSGMFIINPPWTLEKHLAQVLPTLTKVIGINGGG